LKTYKRKHYMYCCITGSLGWWCHAVG